MRPLDAERVEQSDEVVGENVDRVRLVGQIGPAVTDHVVDRHAEVLGEAGDVPGVRLEVPAGAVQQHQVRAGPRLQHAGAHPVDVDVPQRVVEVGELRPDRHVRGQVGERGGSVDLGVGGGGHVSSLLVFIP